MKTAYIYTIIQRWGFIAAVLLLVVMNFLSNAIPFGGQTMAEVSAKYPTLITPAGYAFSIWGLIYFTLAVFAYFQLMKGKEIRFYKIIWPYFIVNALANVLWLVAFQNEYLGVSVLLMAVILITLILTFKVFYRIQRALSTTHRYFFHVPFSMYFGWISVASMVNVAAYIQSLQIEFFENANVLLAVIMLILAAIIGLVILLTKQDYVYALTITWAFVAIWMSQRDVNDVAQTAKFSAIALLAACAIQFVADRIKVAQYGNSVS